MTDQHRFEAEETVYNMLMAYEPTTDDTAGLARTIVAEVLDIAYSPVMPAIAAIPTCRQCGHRWGTNAACESCTVGWG